MSATYLQGTCYLKPLPHLEEIFHSLAAAESLPWDVCGKLLEKIMIYKSNVSSGENEDIESDVSSIENIDIESDISSGGNNDIESNVSSGENNDIESGLI